MAIYEPPGLYVLIVTRNEEHRYLTQVLDYVGDIFNDVFVYDDQSTDHTADVASQSAWVAVRPDGVPSFMENESAFRQAAWDWMYELNQMRVGDWVFCLDADEFLVPAEGLSGDVRTILLECVNQANNLGAQAVSFDVVEVFDVNGGLHYRTDGYWGEIEAARLCRAPIAATFSSRTRGGGSLPEEVLRSQTRAGFLKILHMGYASAEDRVAKYERYIGERGHSAKHIASILSKPTLEPWKGENPLSRGAVTQ